MPKRNGWIMIELVAALGILALLSVGLAGSMHALGRFNKAQLATQQCLSAAQAQLDCIAATGKSIENKEFERLWPHVELSIEKIPGIGDWEGLTLVKVTATVNAWSKKTVTVSLCRYFDYQREEK